MPTDVLKLQALTGVAIRKLDPSAPTFERDMSRILARGHTAAYIAGQAERTGAPLSAFRGLSRAERADIKKTVEGQLGYLSKFKEAIPGLTEKQALARALSYAGAVKETYLAARWGDWEIEPRLLPGRQKCMSNCKCQISVADHGDGTGTLTRTLGTENNCAECPPLAGDHPVKRRAA